MRFDKRIFSVKDSFLCQQLLHHYFSIRQLTEKLCQPLLIEDYVIQTIEDVSPPKWHLAHTSWFFETFILAPNICNYHLFDPLFPYLFNSYYQRIGEFFPRMNRGILSRPTVEKVYAYRRYIDERMENLILNFSSDDIAKITPLITLGLNHEQQHQELLLTDIKYNFSQNPSFPAYHSFSPVNEYVVTELDFIPESGGLIEVGHAAATFCFDNELPRHKVFLAPYSIASRLTTNAEYLEFIQAGGYRDPQWWLSDGWECLQKNGWLAPLYWQQIDNEWHVFTLRGLEKLNLAEPVSHVSFYEADAYARFKSARLVNEVEWEHYAQLKQTNTVENNFIETEIYHPLPQKNHSTQQLFGDVWEWTNSAYLPYPGYQPLYGALGEYNGKFMSNQMVLRGGSCATSKAHIRTSYRNFFQPDKRWQFTGIRLAKNI